MKMKVWELHSTQKRSSLAGRLVVLFVTLFIVAGNLQAQTVIVNETTLISGTYTVTQDGIVEISIVGADGGNGDNTNGGTGAMVTATFAVKANDVIRYIVGQSGAENNGTSAGGGGSTGVLINDTIVMVAGAGAGGDNSAGPAANGLGGSDSINGLSGNGGGPGIGGFNGNGGGATTNTAAAGGGGGINSAGGSGDAGGGEQSDQTVSDLGQLLSIAQGGAGNSSGSAGGDGFTGGGGADEFYSGGGGGYSGGGGAGSNGGAGGGGSFVSGTAVISSITAGTDAASTQSDGSIQITYTQDSTAPSAPQNVSAVAIQDTLAISFDDVNESGSGVFSYSIKRSTILGGPYTQISTITDDESLNYTFNDIAVTEGTQYYYIVTAIDAASNESLNSAEVSAIPDATAPILITAAVTDSILVLDYNELLDPSSVPNASDFTVLVNSIIRSIESVSITSDSVVIELNPTVDEGDTIELSYTAGSNPILDVAGNQASDYTGQPVTNFTVATTPSPPSTLSATAIVGGDIEIVFEDVDATATITEYSIQRSTSQGGPYAEIATVPDNDNATYTFTDTNTIDGTTYYYVITSRNVNSEESANSEELIAIADATLPSVSLISVNDDVLAIDYDELLDFNSIPATGDFTVLVNSNPVTISSIEISGPRVILDLNTAVIAGDVVDVDYTSGGNPIRDLAQNLASSYSNNPATNNTSGAGIFGPDPCPITNDQDVAWACFNGIFDGTSMTANVGGLDIATVTAASGSATTFAPNALQEWSAGAFNGDEFNGPQANPSGTTGDATSLDINIPGSIPSDALILSLNRLRPITGAGTSYTLEAYDGSNNLLTIDDWLTGQGIDGGVCTNNVVLNYTNGNTRIEFQPTISGNPSCASSSTPIWFRITDDNVERIEVRKIASDPDNIHIGLGIVADFGDAPATYGTAYAGNGTPPAFHLLNNSAPNLVYLGAGVDGDGNGAPSVTNNGDDTESTGLSNGDDEDAISLLADINTSQTNYQTTLICTNGGFVSGWIDFDQSGSFDPNEFANSICTSGSVTLDWAGISGIVTGTTSARFRIASDQSQVANPVGAAFDGEVEDYSINIVPPPLPDLAITKTVNNSSPVIGETITYAINVTNPGDFEATGVRVTDQLPSELSFISAIPSQGVFNSASGVWNIGTLAEGDTTTVTLTINALVNPGTLDSTVINTAIITDLNETDPELNNNSASAGITVIPESADIGITKVVDDATPLEGQEINFTVTVTNNGPKTATNLKIIDQLPTGLTYVSSTPSIGTYNNTTGIWDIGVLNNSGVATLGLKVLVNGGTEGSTITNAADIFEVNQTDPESNNNTGSVDITVDTAIFPGTCSEIPTLNFSTGSLIAGTNGEVGAIYEFTSVATGINAIVEIVTKLNANLANIDQSTSGAADNFQPQIGVVDENAGEGYFDFEIRFVDATTGFPRFLSFTATAVDVDGDNNSTREFVGFQRLNSFTVEGTTNLDVGSSSIYTTFESATTLEIGGIDLNNTNNIAYTTYTNEPQFRIRAGIKDPTNTTARLFAIDFDPCAIDLFNNPTDTEIIEVGLTNTIDTNNANVGDTITYTVTASNNQGNTVNNVAVSINVEEDENQQPTGLTFFSATPGQGTTYDNSTGVWAIGTLSGFQTVTLTITATVDNGQEGQTIANTAILTGFDGTDSNLNNNQSTANLYVIDPQSTSCNELPLFSFTNPVLEQGVPLQVSSIYRFPNIASGLDGIVKVLSINNATLDDIDADGIANDAANFSPFFTAGSGSGGGFIDFEIQLVQAGTLTPVKRNFALTGLDIDGTTNGQGSGTLRDYLGFSQNQGYIVQTGNDLQETTAGPFQIFESAVSTDASGTFDIDHMAYILYNYTSIFELRIGSATTNTLSDDRLVDIDFTQCRNDDFTDVTEVFRNADIAVAKTVDELNPLENGTVNFTITATNIGSEDVTELDINEEIPAGLTLVQSTPSQGSYNQLNNLWSVGSITSGNSATLQIEATVNSGITADSLINKVFIQGLNQVDINSANDTSQVVLKIGVELKGVVFEDITGDGFIEDQVFNDAAGDQQALENVEVHLFKDGGDQLPDGADDTLIETTFTNNLGEYTFNIGEDADFWVVVDSKTGELFDGNFWGEQTYGPIGGYCVDGSENTVVKTSAGHCFGGRRGNQSDNITATPVPTDLANAEHLAAITISGTGVNNIDFGFSFNVVTNTNDASNIQGSLRQFITNANEITGANSMRFVPSVSSNNSGGGGNWWTTTLASELPAIIDGLTTISGVAYQNDNPTIIRNDNSNSVGTGGSVGIDEHSSATFTRKEFEIDLNDIGSNALLINSSGAYTIREIAIFNNVNAIRLQNGSSGLIEKNLIGTKADGTDPEGSSRAGIGINIDGASSVDPLIQENYIAFLAGSGIKSNNQSADIEIFNNEIYRTGLLDAPADGIEGLGTWTIQVNRIHENGYSSSSAVNGGNGIEIGGASGPSSGNTIRNNTIYNNAVSGISVLNDVTASVLDLNVIYQNGTNYISSNLKLGAGVKLANPSGSSQNGIRIARNRFYDNYGISIDLISNNSGQDVGVNPNDGQLDASTVTPNGGQDYPVFTLSTLENGVLTVEGYVGTTTTKLTGTFTIQVYKADDDGDSDGLIEVGGTLTRPHGEGRELIGVISTNPDGTFNADIPVPGTVSLAFNDRITAIAISSVNNTSEFSANSRVIPTGVTISGTVYHDLNHNQILDGGEVGLPNVTITLYNTQENNCKSVLTDANGVYQFTNVLNGTYDLIESFGQSVPTPDICTPAENDPVDFISTTPNLRSITVNNLPAIQDFGDFEGSKISGTVFNDNGIGDGTANDGIQNGTEGGISTQLVEAFTGSDVLIDQVTSAADGSYELFVPKSIVGTGGTVKIVETNGTVYLSTGGDAGTTSGNYTIATDVTEFTNTVGIEYESVDFADVAVSILLTDGTQSTQPGGVATFTHLFTAQTAGTVTFTTSSVNNPNINFPTILNNDLNCDGDADPGEPALSPLTSLNVTSGQDICLVVRVTVPNGVNDGATSTTTVTATLDYSNSPTNIQQILTRSDIITVSTVDGGFVIVKAVDKAQALPGDTLTYSINYENLGDEPITQVEVIDEVPVFTTYQSSVCGALPPGFTNCTITTPTVGTRGTIIWVFTGVLQPGESGTVSYKVLIDN